MGLKEKYTESVRKYFLKAPKGIEICPDSVIHRIGSFESLSNLDKRSIIHYILIELEKDGIIKRDYRRVEPNLYKMVCVRK